MTRNEALELADNAIENEETVCFDVCDNIGQIFGNVKHMTWFRNAVADELQEADFEIFGSLN